MVHDLERDARVPHGLATIRCETCLAQETTKWLRQCHICGKTLCAEHYRAGLCPEHFRSLTPTEQEQLLYLYVPWRSLKRCTGPLFLLIYGLSISLLPALLGGAMFFFEFLVGLVILIPIMVTITSVSLIKLKHQNDLKGQILRIINTLDPTEIEHLQKIGLSAAEIEAITREAGNEDE